MSLGIGPMELLILFLLGGGGVGMPFGLPPLPEDPLLARVAPQECLFYGAWSGTATPDPKSGNRTERLLAEEELQSLIQAIDKTISQAIQKGAGAQAPQIEDVYGLTKTLLMRPAALYVSKVTPGPTGIPMIEAGLIVNAGEQAQQVEQAITKLLTAAGLPRSGAMEVMLDGVRFEQLALPPAAPPVLWGFHGQYLIIAAGRASAEQIVDGLKRPRGPPTWLTAMRKDLPVERVSTISYVNVAGIKQLVLPFVGPRGERMLESLGLSGVESLSSVSGLEGAGMSQMAHVRVNGPFKGVLAFGDGAPLTPADLAPIPRDATLAAAARLDLAAATASIKPFWEELDPGLRGELDKQFNPETLGFDFDRSMKSLGDVWCLYSSPSEGGFLITGLTAVARVRDRAGVQQGLDGLARLLRKNYPPPTEEEQQQRGRRGPALTEFTFRGQTVSVMDLSGDQVPIAPSWCLTDKELVFSLYPQTIKAYLSRPADAESLATVPEVAAMFAAGKGPLNVSYQDTRTLFRTLYPLAQAFAPMVAGEMRRGGIEFNAALLPSVATIDRHLGPAITVMRRTDSGLVLETRQVLPLGGTQLSSAAPVAVAALLPAVGAARDAARRAQATNNMKQIALAMHNYHDVNAQFPAPAIYDKKGKALLSWRVQVLPYLEQQALYNEFHLDEPWDSEHNRKLIPRMPQIFKTPAAAPIEPGKTVYLFARGKGTLFEKNRGPVFAEITDGTSNTAMCIEAAADRAVVWTKPDDLAYDPEKPLAGLGGLWRDGFIMALCDGSVRFLRNDIDPKTLRALFTHQGGEVINLQF